MPGKRAPRRRDDRILLRVDWRSRAVNVDHEQLANVFEVAEPKRFRSGIGADDAHPEKVRAHDGGGGRDQRMEVLGLGACTPTIGEGVGWSVRDADWDVEVAEVDAAELVASAMFSMNGWLAPPWV